MTAEILHHDSLSNQHSLDICMLPPNFYDHPSHFSTDWLPLPLAPVYNLFLPATDIRFKFDRGRKGNINKVKKKINNFRPKCKHNYAIFTFAKSSKVLSNSSFIHSLMIIKIFHAFSFLLQHHKSRNGEQMDSEIKSLTNDSRFNDLLALFVLLKASRTI